MSFAIYMAEEHRSRASELCACFFVFVSCLLFAGGCAGAGDEPQHAKPVRSAGGYAPWRYMALPNLSGRNVTFITDTPETQAIAEEVIAKTGGRRSKPVDADYYVAVVRSRGTSPLRFQYREFSIFYDDVLNQPNRAGPVGHVYLFRLNNDLSVSEAFHDYFEWLDR